MKYPPDRISKKNAKQELLSKLNYRRFMFFWWNPFYRNRNLIQLQTLINKYDTDIVNKMKESDVLSEDIKKKREEIKEFNVEFEKIEEEYMELVYAKQMEEKIEFENKLYLFTANRAAKIIQKYWKIFWKKKQKELKSKTKDKKGKKKK